MMQKDTLSHCSSGSQPTKKITKINLKKYSYILKETFLRYKELRNQKKNMHTVI